MKRSVAAPELQNQIRRQYCRERKLVPHLCVLAPTQNSVGLRITEFGVNGVERSAFQERIVFGNLCSSLSTAFSVLASCGVEAETVMFGQLSSPGGEGAALLSSPARILLPPRCGPSSGLWPFLNQSLAADWQICHKRTL